MMKIKRVRTADVVVAAFRFGKEEGTVGSLILGLYDDDGELHVIGHTSGFTAKQKRELVERARAVPDARARAPAGRAAGSPTRSSSGRGCGPSSSCEIAFDHITGNRIRHGAKFQRWRPDKKPEECRMEQLRVLTRLTRAAYNRSPCGSLASSWRRSSRCSAARPRGAAVHATPVGDVRHAGLRDRAADRSAPALRGRAGRHDPHGPRRREARHAVPRHHDRTSTVGRRAGAAGARVRARLRDLAQALRLLHRHSPRATTAAARSS